MRVGKTALSIVVLVILTTLGVGAGTTFASSSSDHRVSLCHATDSVTSPYELIEVAEAAAANGHMGQGHQGGRDIIPPFEFRGRTYSQNWDARGQAIFNAGCTAHGSTTTTGTTGTTTSTTGTTNTTTTSVTTTTTGVGTTSSVTGTTGTTATTGTTVATGTTTVRTTTTKPKAERPAKPGLPKPPATVRDKPRDFPFTR